MTRNVTLRLNEELLKKVRYRAVDHNLSLSAWVASILERLVVEEEEYVVARERATRRLSKGLRLGGVALSREETHAR